MNQQAPLSTPGMRRTYKLNIRLNEVEKRHLFAYACQTNTPVSRVIRRILADHRAQNPLPTPANQ